VVESVREDDRKRKGDGRHIWVEGERWK